MSYNDSKKDSIEYPSHVDTQVVYDDDDAALAALGYKSTAR